MGVRCQRIRSPQKSFRLRNQLFTLAVTVLLAGPPVTSSAQVNRWTKPTSGNWEEMQWSLGVLPGPGQSVMIDNAGWKAVQISGNAAANFPQSLNMRDLTISSPVDSFNTLLLNYAGFDVPLTVNYSLTVASNSAMTMHGSALNLATPPGVGLSVGGEFNQNDSSQVNGTQLAVGWVGSGVYNLNSGTLALGHAFVGGPYTGVFNQNGGSNGTGIVHLEDGTYNFNGGDFNSEVYFGSYTTGGRFRQNGGRINRGLKIFRGIYELNSGAIFGDLMVGVSDGLGAGGAGDAIQNGGTNFASIHLGDGGNGSYRLSNGVVQSPSIAVGAFGYYQQMGGTVTTPDISFVGGEIDREYRPLASGWIRNGYLSATTFSMERAEFSQEGGTNQVGHLEFLDSSGAYNVYHLSGGLLTAYLTTVGAPAGGGFYQSGGTHRVANQLTVFGRGPYDFYRGDGYVLSGGELVAPTIYLFPGAIFRHTGGTIVNSGTLALVSARLFPGPSQQFGVLHLYSRYDQPNSDIHMPSGACVLRFLDSSSGSWISDSTLIISNWNGSILGGGSHQIIFGNSASALKSWQLSVIFFRDPGGGLSPGLYSAKILPSGEIVPDTSPTGRIPPRIAIRKDLPGALQITVTGEAGFDYGILTSSNLADWALWTNGVATNGTFSALDSPSANRPKRFYKAVLIR